MARILVVDDDPDTRVLLNSVLGEEMGHALTFAPDGAVAVERFRKSGADAVITDLVMPNLNGLLVIEAILAIDPKARIIAISGKAPQDLARAKEAGAIAALPKPLDRAALGGAVQAALTLEEGEDLWERAW